MLISQDAADYVVGQVLVGKDINGNVTSLVDSDGTVLSVPLISDTGELLDPITNRHIVLSDDISPYYFCAYTLDQFNGRPFDITGNNNHASFGVNLSNNDAWAIAGVAKSISLANADGGINIPPINWNMASGDSLIIGFNLSHTYQLTDGILGSWNSLSTNTAGLRAVASGVNNFQFSISDGVHSKAGSALSGLLDGVSRSFLIAICGKTKKMYIFVDGIVVDVVDVSIVTGNTYNSGRYFTLGNDGKKTNTGAGTEAGNTLPANWSNFHALVIKEIGLPNNLTDIANKLKLVPNVLLKKTDFVFPSERIAMLVIGQSNEAGHVTNVPQIVRRNVAYNIGDRIRASAEISSGLTFRCTTSGTSHTTTEPSSNYAAAAAGGTVTDGSAIFTAEQIRNEFSSKYGEPIFDPVSPNGHLAHPAIGDFGSMLPLIAEQVARKTEKCLYPVNCAVGATGIVPNWCGISSNTSTGSVFAYNEIGFDPNGYINAAKSAISAVVGVDKKIAIIQFGQSDSNNYDSNGASTRAQYAQAHINIINVLLPVVDTFIVNLSYVWSSHVDPYSTQLWPALLDVVAYYAIHNPGRVLLGVDLSTIFPVGIMTSVDGLHADQQTAIHGAAQISNKLIDILTP